MKKTWEWEENNFEKLQEHFSSLSETVAQTAEMRGSALDRLSEVERLRIDQFARQAILKEEPELIDEALASAPIERETLKVRLTPGPFSGKAFLHLLESGDIEKYTPDEQVYTSIHPLSSGSEWQLLSFEEANQLGILDEMLDRFLMTAYESMDYEAPFNEVAEEVGEKVFADLLQDIKRHATEEIEQRDDYAPHRFDAHLKRMREIALNDPESFKIHPWALEEVEEYLSDENLGLSEGDFSEIHQGSFYQLIKKEKNTTSKEEIAKAKEHLKRDAQKTLMNKILSRQ